MFFVDEIINTVYFAANNILDKIAQIIIPIEYLYFDFNDEEI